MSKKRKEKENVHQKIQSSWPNNIEATCFFVKRHSVPLYRETTNWALSFFISFERRQSVGNVGHAIRRANEGIGFPTGGKQKATKGRSAGYIHNLPRPGNECLECFFATKIPRGIHSSYRQSVIRQNGARNESRFEGEKKEGKKNIVDSRFFEPIRTESQEKTRNQTFEGMES